jgi:hypothetical protein
MGSPADGVEGGRARHGQASEGWIGGGDWTLDVMTISVMTTFVTISVKDGLEETIGCRLEGLKRRCPVQCLFSAVRTVSLASILTKYRRILRIRDIW